MVAREHWTRVDCPVCGNQWHVRYDGEPLMPCSGCMVQSTMRLGNALVFAGVTALNPDRRVIEVHRNGLSGGLVAVLGRDNDEAN